MSRTPLVHKQFWKNVLSEQANGTGTFAQRREGPQTVAKLEAITGELIPGDIKRAFSPFGGGPFSSSIWGPARAKAHYGTTKKNPNPRQFFADGGALEWFVLILFSVIGLAAHGIMFMSDGKNLVERIAAVVFWLALAAAYAIILHNFRPGHDVVDWIAGYTYELIFGLENLFVFHLLIMMFNPPQLSVRKVLRTVMICQILFELGFFMGLAHAIHSIHALPYILGTWLIYVGISVMREEEHESKDESELLVFQALRACLGHRFRDTYTHCGNFFVADENDGKWFSTKLLPLAACLVVLDFCLEVDVCVTKIEEFQSSYIAFSSSCIASLLIPDFFALTVKTFSHYKSLQYCIASVMIVFGLELWLHNYIAIPDLLKCIGIVVYMGAWMLVAKYAFHEENVSSKGTVG